MNVYIKIITTLVFAAATAGCATIIHGTHQDVGISSSPTNAEVKVDGIIAGSTPVNAKLTRKDNHVVSITLAGYQPYETTFTRGVSGWVWGNIVFGGLIGLAVDAIDGGLYQLTPEQVHAEMRAQGAAVTQINRGIYLAVVLKPDRSWQKIGNLVVGEGASAAGLNTER